MKETILIVGGVAGGASAAARLRRLNEQTEIILFEKGPYISFANCGLPYHIGDVIDSREALLLQTPESFNARFNVDVRVNNEVLSVDPQTKSVRVRGEQGEYTQVYDKLILAPGSTPLVPPIPGIRQDHVMTLWTIPDMDRIISYIKDNHPKSAIVCGGGFIGLEVAENLRELGLAVSLVEMQNQVMAPLDLDMAMIVHQELISKGVDLHLNEKVEEFLPSGVRLASGKVIDGDLILVSLGVRAQTDFLKDSGIELNQRKGIIVNEYLETNIPDIYAVGDAIEVKHFVSGVQTMIPLAGPANKQGRLVADIISGNRRPYKGSQGTGIAKIFDLTAASTGLNEKMLHAMGKQFEKDYLISQIIVKDHAGYYPGATPMTLKAIFEPVSGKLLGIQGVGYDGVDKRVDIFATAQRLGATIQDLAELELNYAPPFSSAKDPINMVGFVGQNILEGKVRPIHVQELADHPDAFYLDVREPEELVAGAIPGAHNIPLNSLRERLEELPRDKEIILNCAIGLRGYVASTILKNHGFTDVRNLAGGYSHYAVFHNELKEDHMSNDFSDSGNVTVKNIPEGDTIVLNVSGLSCPGPIIQVAKKMEELKDGDILEVRATDPGFKRDIVSWAERTKNTFLETISDGPKSITTIRKGTDIVEKHSVLSEIPHNKTIVVFSGDLDKAIASLIIANGAASMGRKVTMFYTFWGLNILRRRHKVAVKKNVIEKAFGAMMPRGTTKMGLSRMNFGGAGAKLIRSIMKTHNVDQVEVLLQQALDNGVHMIACNMSMDLMGIKPEELIDGIELGGVATYLGEAEEADTNLFI